MACDFAMLTQADVEGLELLEGALERLGARRRAPEGATEAPGGGRAAEGDQGATRGEGEPFEKFEEFVPLVMRWRVRGILCLAWRTPEDPRWWAWEAGWQRGWTVSFFTARQNAEVAASEVATWEAIEATWRAARERRRAARAGVSR